MDQRGHTDLPSRQPVKKPIKYKPPDHYAKYFWMGLSVILAISTLVFARMYYTKSAEMEQMEQEILFMFEEGEFQNIPEESWAESYDESSTYSESDLEQQCYENMRKILSACYDYAADHNGKFPTSWSGLVPEYLPAELYCPENNARYTIRWHQDKMTEIDCPNHRLDY